MHAWAWAQVSAFIAERNPVAGARRTRLSRAAIRFRKAAYYPLLRQIQPSQTGTKARTHIEREREREGERIDRRVRSERDRTKRRRRSKVIGAASCACVCLFVCVCVGEV
jgi:hypothetical protein